MVTLNKTKFCSTALQSQDGVRHGFFTRQGGVSTGLYSSLNCGLGSKDDPESVAENRARVAEMLGTGPDRLMTLFQIHSAKAVVAKKPWATDGAPEADAVVTNVPGLAIGVLTATIGPAISQKAYEVGTEYVESFLAEDKEAGPFFANDPDSGEPHFDLTGYVAERLAKAGVSAITDLELCTYCDETRLFSYRRSQHHGEPDYGRQISAILLT